MARTGAPSDNWRTIAGAARKAGIVVAAATMLAAAATLAAGQTLIPRGPGSAADVPAASFSDRFSFRAIAPDCAARSWPYFAAECLRMPDGSRARPARIIAIDRQIPDGQVRLPRSDR